MNESKKEEVSSLPENFKEEKEIKTKVSSLKKMIEDSLNSLKDIASGNIMIPVTSRMSSLMKELKTENSAINQRHRRDTRDKGHWHTIKPKLHIRELQGVKIDNKNAEVRFEVYDMDEKGNKKLFSRKAMVQLADGATTEREVTADYRIAYEVVYTIKYGKSTTREIIKFDLGEHNE